MYIGAHVSIASGIFNAPLNAAAEGSECFQMFTRSPRGGPVSILSNLVVEKYKENCVKSKIKHTYVHAPYYINFASNNNRVRHSSAKLIREELERSSKLGAKALMTHLGSSKDVGPKEATKMVIKGLRTALTGYQGATQFLIENSAGAGGTIIGDTFEEIGGIIKALPQLNIGVCFDTCHAFASGYDLRNHQAIEEAFMKFDKLVGLSRIKLIHANDSKGNFHSHLDRHEHIGLGNIGKEGFKELIGHAKLKNVDFILETPKGENRTKDIKILKRLRNP